MWELRSAKLRCAGVGCAVNAMCRRRGVQETQRFGVAVVGFQGAGLLPFQL